MSGWAGFVVTTNRTDMDRKVLQSEARYMGTWNGMYPVFQTIYIPEGLFYVEDESIRLFRGDRSEAMVDDRFNWANYPVRLVRHKSW